MANHVLETTSRLVAWRIDSWDEIEFQSAFESREFMIGKWYWLLVYFSTHDKKIYLILKPKDGQNLPCPIASYVLRVFCVKGSPIITAKDVFEDLMIPYGQHLLYDMAIDISTFHATSSITFSVEFLDLKFEDGDDGKIISIWTEENPETNTSNEPISRMLSESICTDIEINARDGSIEAHRAILAAYSPVLKSMFSNNYIEKETSAINMNDMSIGACRAMLNSIYGNTRRNELRTYIMELVVAADKYDIVKLKIECEAILCEDVGAKNVFERLVCAHRYGLFELRSVCLFYLVKMGMIFDLREDYNSFVLEADPELILQVSNAILDAWKST